MLHIPKGKVHSGEYFAKITLLSKSLKALDLHLVSTICSHNLFWYHHLASVLLLQNVCFGNKFFLSIALLSGALFYLNLKNAHPKGLKWRNPMASSVWRHWFTSFHCIVFGQLMGKVKQILLMRLCCPVYFSKMIGASLSSLRPRCLFQSLQDLVYWLSSIIRKGRSFNIG